MRYEAKTERRSVAGAARALGKPPRSSSTRVIRDEKSFWGGRVVEIEVEEQAAGAPARPEPERASRARVGSRKPRAARGAAASRPDGGRAAARGTPGATDADAVAAVETTLTELLSAAGLLVEIRRREATGDELLFELFGDDVEPLLANKGEGLTGLEVLVGRIASKRLGNPVHPRLDAEGFRAHRKEALEELARQIGRRGPPFAPAPAASAAGSLGAPARASRPRRGAERRDGVGGRRVHEERGGPAEERVGDGRDLPCLLRLLSSTRSSRSRLRSGAPRSRWCVSPVPTRAASSARSPLRSSRLPRPRRPRLADAARRGRGADRPRPRHVLRRPLLLHR